MINLGTPRDIKISPDTEELLKQIDGSIQTYNKLKPLDPETESRIKMAFLPDRVTASLNMEGIVATRRQTLAIMDAMTISENHTKTEKEILNALKADEYTFEASGSENKLSEKAIREINALIEEDVGETPGAYRLRDVKISQADFTPPPAQDVPSAMKSLVDTYNEVGFEHPVLGAAWLHNRFTYIHPFLDGNGRTGRLLQDYCLLSNGLFPTGIPSSKRDDYYDALAAADKNDWDALVQIIAMRELDTISRATVIAQERENRAKWTGALAKRATEKKAGALYKRYLVWAHKFQELRNAFEFAVEDFNRESPYIKIRMESFDILDSHAWRNVIDRGYGDKTWFFSTVFNVDNTKAYKYVFYFRRHRATSIDYFTDGNEAVGLFITGGNFNEDYDFSGRFIDQEIGIREVLFHHEDIILYTGTGKTDNRGYEKVELEHIHDTNKIVQRFFEDVLVKKMGI